MSLCVAAAGKVTALALSAFTLSWTHSAERVEWQEDWRLAPAGLELVEARIKGSGAGMEPPEGASFDGEWWRYRPDLPLQPRLVLARSGATPGGWSLCHDGECRELDALAGEAELITLSPCPR